MIGKTTIVLNEVTVIEAIQQYFTKNVFDASQIVKVVDCQPKRSTFNNDDPWEYTVVVESPEAVNE